MQKVLKSGKIQKIAVVLVIVILCNFIIPSYSHASVGGVLLSPIKIFLSFIGDMAISAVQVCFTGQWIGAANAKAKPDSGLEDNWAKNWDGEIDWPTIIVSPEEIFAGKVSALNVNFLRSIDTNYTDASNAEEIDDYRARLQNGTLITTKDIQSAMDSLRTTIAQWYNLLRNIAAAALFCVLIYMGIRMLLSSISEEKAKYKKMMIDWIIAICLVFFLHYIMAVVMFVTESMVKVIGGGLNNNQYVITIEDQNQTFKMSKEVLIGKAAETKDVNDQAKVAKINNILECARVYVSAEDQGIAFTYLLVYLVLIVYTVIFIFIYLKRFMYMAFLTLMAPMIAITYPIDKIKDGHAQAFNAWLVEYIFNALLQPIHLLIYLILIGSAMTLAQTNFLYMIVALGFITPAEKLLRSMFGISKAQTAGGMGGFAKGAIASQVLNKMKSGGSSGKISGSKSSNSSSGSKSSASSKPRQSKGLEAYMERKC